MTTQLAPNAGENVTGGDSRNDAMSTLSAAYSDPSQAGAAIQDLEQAGLRPTVVTPLTPWSDAGSPVDTVWDHPLKTAAIGALTLGVFAAFGSMIWLDGRRWLLYGAIGALVGAFSGWFGSAMAATTHPVRDEDMLFLTGSGLTIEVMADGRQQAQLAESVMGRYGPTVFRARTRPGPRSPSERVMWQHEEGLSPLEVLGEWLSGSPTSTPPRRGRHLQA